MLCYKDMTWCNASDCTRMTCNRNMKGPNYTPDEFWSTRVCVGDLKSNCKFYTNSETEDGNN